MKIEETQVKKLKLTELEALDPVTVFIEEYNEGEAKVIIECYGKSWSAYWGSMGGDVKDFFGRTNVDYLVNCFDRGIDATTDDIDRTEFVKRLVPALRKRILEWRREYSMTAENARLWWDWEWDESVYDRDFFPEHTYDDYSLPEELKETDFFYDSEEFGFFCEEFGIPYERNHEYDYLYRIVAAVQKAIIGES